MFLESWLGMVRNIARYILLEYPLHAHGALVGLAAFFPFMRQFLRVIISHGLQFHLLMLKTSSGNDDTRKQLFGGCD